MRLLVVRDVAVGLEPVQALLRVPVVRQLAATAAVLLPAAALAGVAVWVVFCCCNNRNKKVSE